jgi:Fe-S cluster assembly protein SufD
MAQSAVATLPQSETHPVTHGFDAFLASREGREPEIVRGLRSQAMDRFHALGFPTTKLEDWRFTNVAPIARSSFVRASQASGAGSAEPSAIEPWTFASARAALVFVDGVFSAELSHTEGLPEGVVFMSLGRALADAERGDEVAAQLGRHARFDDHAFVALNTALFEDGAYLSVARNTVLEETLHVLHYSTGATGPEGEPVATYSRNLFVVEESAQATVVETYAGPPESQAFNCPVTEVVCGANSNLDHYKMQRESTDAFHMATFQLHQSRDSDYALHSISLGGGIVRNDVNTRLDGPGCESTLNGLYMVEGSQFVDHHMKVDHAAPNCHSFELFKGILQGRSRAVFNGLIHVHPGAQQTDAEQENKNLLLSDQALVHSNPQLEIFADDVKCTHGSTIGQLDDDAVFYLRSRGIGAEAAQSLLTYAFASDIVTRIKVPELRQELEDYLIHRLPQGEVVRQAL